MFKSLFKIFLYVSLALTTALLCAAAGAQPSPLTPEELGLIDAILAYAGAKWDFIEPFAATGYIAVLVRTIIPRKYATRNGFKWFFWIWDRIAGNFGSTKNAS